jgi:hypothetical protein
VILFEVLNELSGDRLKPVRLNPNYLASRGWKIVKLTVSML